MNPLSKNVEKGTSGELLVILRLLEYHVQASFTLKDSGNDLIAIKDRSMKTIQVKSSIRGKWRTPKQVKEYDILALVYLKGGDETHLNLDDSTIYLLSKKEVGETRSYQDKNMSEQFKMSNKRIKGLFS